MTKYAICYSAIKTTCGFAVDLGTRLQIFKKKYFGISTIWRYDILEYDIYPNHDASKCAISTLPDRLALGKLASCSAQNF